MARKRKASRPRRAGRPVHVALESRRMTVMDKLELISVQLTHLHRRVMELSMPVPQTRLELTLPRDAVGKAKRMRARK